MLESGARKACFTSRGPTENDENPQPVERRWCYLGRVWVLKCLGPSEHIPFDLLVYGNSQVPEGLKQKSLFMKSETLFVISPLSFFGLLGLLRW